LKVGEKGSLIQIKEGRVGLMRGLESSTTEEKRRGIIVAALGEGTRGEYETELG